MIVTDRETWDRWNETGEWVLFRAGEPCRNASACLWAVNWHNVGGPEPECECEARQSIDLPPAEFVEWGKPCETCGGMEGSEISAACPDCLDGKRRIAITVPCPAVIDGAWVACDGTRSGGGFTCPDHGRVTLGQAVIEHGPLVVSDIDADCPSEDHLYIDWRRIGGQLHRFLARCTHGDVVEGEWDLPPDLDPASLVGTWGVICRKVEP